MISFETEDVIAVLQLLLPYLITLGVILVLILAMVFLVKLFIKGKNLRHMVRGQLGMLSIAATLILVNLMCFGPLETLLDLTNKTSDGVSEETTALAKETAIEIAEEGFVLLENRDNFLPLTDEGEKKLSLYGYRSANPIYGGTGSGGINSLYEIVSLRSGLEKAGFSIDSSLYDFYSSYKSGGEVTITNQAWDLPEPATDSYGTLVSDAKSGGYNTALIVLGRLAGEGHNDMPLNPATCETFNNNFNSPDYQEYEDGEHYLELSESEERMIKLVTSNYENVILVYNGSNPMELGFVDDYSQIKSVIWAPGPGNIGFTALGEILSGAISPSGRTTDTFPYDIKQSPSYNNFELTRYSNLEDMAVDGMNAGKAQKYYPTFVNYVEGVYVGYKYWETAAEEGIIDYDASVQYPFGYGLSYTSFTQEMKDFSSDNGKITFSVEVTNTGEVAGKDTVEVYFNPPYVNGGIEKSSKNLIAFEKTSLLGKGASETIDFSIDIEDMASYDYLNKKGYVLEAGDYVISIQKDSHSIIDSETFTLESTIDYSSSKRASDQSLATNKLEDAQGEFTYLSRKDSFANLSQASAAPSNTVMSEANVAQYHLNSNYDPTAYINPDDTMPTTGKAGTLQLKDLRGKDYDDPLWEQLLDQLSVSDMDTLTAMGGYHTEAIESIGKIQTNDFDGPAAINNNFTGQGSFGFPIEVVIACTFNKDLVTEYGERMGQMNRELDGHGWYAPGMNMHRSPFTGRNYEYYSEDSCLAGEMAASAVIGAAKVGVYSFIKHFALYDFNGKMTCVWANEQAIREIYLKPFETAVKKGGADGVMVSWSFLGTKWVGERSDMINEILRDEWGFQGVVITDFFRNNGHGFMNADVALANGVDLMLSTYSGPQNHVSDLSAASNIKYMRNACHNILYTVVNSWAYEGEVVTRIQTWRVVAIVLNVVIGAGVLAGAALLTISYLRKERKKKEGPAE